VLITHDADRINRKQRKTLFLTLRGAALLVSIVVVVSGRAEEQVRRVDARANVTGVANKDVGWNIGLIEQLVSHAVSRSEAPLVVSDAHRGPSITCFGVREAGPQPAPVCDLDVSHKAGEPIHLTVNVNTGGHPDVS
jgi:hypothetical protein